MLVMIYKWMNETRSFVLALSQPVDEHGHMSTCVVKWERRAPGAALAKLIKKEDVVHSGCHGYPLFLDEDTNEGE